MRVNPAAREELRRLSAIYGTTAALSAVIDDRITLLELVGPSGADVGVRVGQSYPFAPPVGLMFVLWDDEALRDLAGQGTDDPAAHRHRAPGPGDRANAAPTGYLVERLTPGGRTALRTDGGHVEHPARRTAGSARRAGLRHRRTGLPAQRDPTAADSVTTSA